MAGKANGGRRIIAGSVGILLMVSWLALPALGAEIELTISVDTVVHAPEGSLVELSRVEVSDDLQGAECAAMITATNQSSVHPDSDLILSSGGTSVVLSDVERAPGTMIEGEGTLRLGEEIVVSVRLGPDEVFSAGSDVTLTCDEVSATTTSTTSTTAPQPTTTTSQPTTTTSQPTTTTTDEVLPTVITTSTTAAPTTTVEDEVLDTEVLPFTGGDGDNDLLALLAGGLGLLGALVLVSTRRMEEK